MKTLPIIQYGNPLLRKPCRPVVEVNDEMRQLAHLMIITMGEAGGIGLASPQIGQDLNLMVIANLDPAGSTLTMGEDRAAQKLEDWLPMALFNPVVTPFGPVESYREGCLSIPNTFGPVLRPTGCRVAARDAGGMEIRFEATGLLARVIQHEYDHLLGIMFFDRMTTEDRARLADKIKAHHELNRPK